MAQVVIEGKSYEAREGERLAEALRRFGFSVPLPCGGRGSCGKCRVTVDGRAELACQYEIHSDITVALPERETIVSETGARASGHLTERSALALDIGTTTLALALVFAVGGTWGRGMGWLTAVLAALLWVPMSQVVIDLFNWLLGKLHKPRGTFKIKFVACPRVHGRSDCGFSCCPAGGCGI